VSVGSFEARANTTTRSAQKDLSAEKARTMGTSRSSHRDLCFRFSAALLLSTACSTTERQRTSSCFDGQPDPTRATNGFNDSGPERRTYAVPRGGGAMRTRAA
jgi:hypothetical protein